MIAQLCPKVSDLHCYRLFKVRSLLEFCLITEVLSLQLTHFGPPPCTGTCPHQLLDRELRRTFVVAQAYCLSRKGKRVFWMDASEVLSCSSLLEDGWWPSLTRSALSWQIAMDSKKADGWEGKTFYSIELVSSGQLAICVYSIQTILKCIIIYVFNGPGLTPGALKVFHLPENEIVDTDIRADYLSRNLCCLSHCVWKSQINVTPLRSYLPPHSWQTQQSPLLNSAYLGLDRLKELTGLYLGELSWCLSCCLPKGKPGLNSPGKTYSCGVPSDFCGIWMAERKAREADRHLDASENQPPSKWWASLVKIVTSVVYF